MAIKRFSAQELSELEGDASVFAAAPRHVPRAQPFAPTPAEVQTIAISAVREQVFQVLMQTGYERGLAEKVAEEVADAVPVIERKLRATGS